MKDEIIEKEHSIHIDYKRLTQFLFRVIAGIGILNIWVTLVVLSVAILMYGVHWASSFDGFMYALALLFIPIGILCWWVCTMLSLEFLSEIGIELKGMARFIVVPIAFPLAGISFMLGLWASVGETIKTRIALYASFVIGITAVASLFVLFM